MAAQWWIWFVTDVGWSPTVPYVTVPDTATELLLDKACQKLRGIQDVPSQRITDLEAAIRQMRPMELYLR